MISPIDFDRISIAWVTLKRLRCLGFLSIGNEGIEVTKGRFEQLQKDFFHNKKALEKSDRVVLWNHKIKIFYRKGASNED